MVIKDGELKDIELLIFDIDQTLVDWESFEDLVIKTFKDENVEMPENYWNNYLLTVYNSMKKAVNEPIFSYEYIENVLRENNIDNIDPVHYFKLWVHHEGDRVKMIPGADKMLSELSKNYRLICATNWFYDSQVRKLSKFNLLKYFSKIYTCEGICAKPNDLHYKHVLKQESIIPSKVVMIGDGSPDIPNKYLGIKNILFDQNQSKRNLYDSSDVVVTELADIPKVLSKNKLTKS